MATKIVQEGHHHTDFSTEKFWCEVHESLSSAEHSPVLKRAREHCILPFTLHVPLLEQEIDTLLAEAAELDKQMQQQRDEWQMHSDTSRQLTEKYEQMACVSRKRPQDVSTA